MEGFNSIYSEEVYSIAPPVTVIIGVPWDNMKEDQRILLSKILQAVKQSLDSVRVLSVSHFDLSDYSDKPSKVLAFIAPPKGIELYEVIQTGVTSVIFSDPFDILITDDGSKRKLWGALKSMF